MEEISYISLLPHEVISHIMDYMELDDLFQFAQVNHLSNSLSDDEDVWKTAFCRSLPKIHSALSQLPHPEYWQYKVSASRLFGYLILREKKRSMNAFKMGSSLGREGVCSAGEPNGRGCRRSKEKSGNEPEYVMKVMIDCYNKRSVPLMLTGCYLLRRLTYTPTDCSPDYQQEMTNNRRILGKSVEVLLNILRFIQGEPPLVAAAICAINNVACDSNCEKIVQASGIEVILQAITNFPLKVAVVDYGASALANIMREIKDDDAINTIIANLEKILGLFDLPEALPKNLISVLDLCTVLAKHSDDFCNNFGPRVLPLVKDLITKNVTLPAGTGTGAGVGATGAGAGAGVSAGAGATGAAGAIVSSATGTGNLIFIACLTIHEFCNHSEENRKIALSLNLVPILLELAETTTETNILYSLFLALCFMLWENAEEFHQADFEKFITLAIQKMKFHSSDAKLQLGLAVILGNYAANNSSHWQFIKSFNIAPLLEKAISSLVSNPDSFDDIVTILEL